MLRILIECQDEICSYRVTCHSLQGGHFSSCQLSSSARVCPTNTGCRVTSTVNTGGTALLTIISLDYLYIIVIDILKILEAFM